VWTAPGRSLSPMLFITSDGGSERLVQEIPLSVTKLPRASWQLLIDKVADNLQVWKRKLIYKSGRLTLIKTTLAAVPVHRTISTELPARVGCVKP
jgi:hypothetical protein